MSDLSSTELQNKKWAEDAKYILDWLQSTPLGPDRILADSRKYTALYDEYNSKLKSEDAEWAGTPLTLAYIHLCNDEYRRKCIFYENLKAAKKLNDKLDKRNKIKH